MIEAICRFILSVVNWIPEQVWLTIIVVGSIFLKVAGESIFAFIKLVFMLIVAFVLLEIVGWLLPTWVEIILLIGLVILIIWAAT